jgi:hypothetical protein
LFEFSSFTLVLEAAGNDPKEFLDRYDKNESVEDARQLIAELES